MKKAYTLFALFVLLATMAVAANAQTAGRSQLLANVPFEFKVGEKTMPAGEYVIVRVNPSSDQALVRLSTRDRSSNALIQMSWVTGKAATESMLVFHRYGDRYFLAETWIDGETEGLRAPRSSAERATQKQLASMKAETETVSLRNR